MIRKVTIRNFKKFDFLEFDIPDFSVIAGPNNSGKTTLLQAIAAWSEIADLWRSSDLGLAKDDDGNYPGVELEPENFRSVPVSGLTDLWKDKAIRNPASIAVRTDRWEVEFDLVYDDRSGEFFGRPAKNSVEDDLDSYVREPVRALYISPLSGLESSEKVYSRDVVLFQLAHGLGGTVLRNMLHSIGKNTDKWNSIKCAIRSFFGYELLSPSGIAPIISSYRHSTEIQSYDLANAASGFLQILMIHAAMLYDDSLVLLVDEPDAHLHVFLKEKVYRHLRDHARRMSRQIIIATHSSQLIGDAHREGGNRLKLVTTEGLVDVTKREMFNVMRLETEDIVNSRIKRAVLYLEGKTDIDILREWAVVLDHPSARFLGEPFCVLTSEKRLGAMDHFKALSATVGDVFGMEIRDSNSLVNNDDDYVKRKSMMEDVPENFELFFWRRYEIENYLVHPRSLVRFIEGETGDKEFAKKCVEARIPPIRIENPFAHESIDADKGKHVIRRILSAANIDMRQTDYYLIARRMKKKEIHPDVVEALDKIAARLLRDGRRA